MSAVIELEDSTRSFGSVRALDGLSLAIPRGSVVGLLGLNGAGKTITMRLLTGLLRADAGTVRVLGEDPWTMPPEGRRLERGGIGLAALDARPRLAALLVAPFEPGAAALWLRAWIRSGKKDRVKRELRLGAKTGEGATRT